MMVQDPIVNRELDQLKRGYRDIHAPVNLATRIRTVVAGRGARSHRWISVTAATAIVAVAWLLPNLLQRQPVGITRGEQTLVLNAGGTKTGNTGGQDTRSVSVAQRNDAGDVTQTPTETPPGIRQTADSSAH